MVTEALDVASDDPPDEALSCRRRAWDVPRFLGYPYKTLPMFRAIVETSPSHSDPAPHPRKKLLSLSAFVSCLIIRDRPNTVSESTVSNTERSEFFWPSPSSGERTQWVPLRLLFMWQSALTQFFAKLTEFAPKLSEGSIIEWVLFSETVLSKQYSAPFPISGNIPKETYKVKNREWPCKIFYLKK